MENFPPSFRQFTVHDLSGSGDFLGLFNQKFMDGPTDDQCTGTHT